MGMPPKPIFLLLGLLLYYLFLITSLYPSSFNTFFILLFLYSFIYTFISFHPSPLITSFILHSFFLLISHFLFYAIAEVLRIMVTDDRLLGDIFIPLKDDRCLKPLFDTLNQIYIFLYMLIVDRFFYIHPSSGLLFLYGILFILL